MLALFRKEEMYCNTSMYYHFAWKYEERYFLDERALHLNPNISAYLKQQKIQGWNYEEST